MELSKHNETIARFGANQLSQKDFELVMMLGQHKVSREPMLVISYNGTSSQDVIELLKKHISWLESKKNLSFIEVKKSSPK